MPTPIPELMAIEVVARLREIKTANNYDFTASQVDRVNRDGSTFEYRHLSIRVDQPGQERIPESDCSGNPPAIAWSQTFEVRCFCRNSNATEQPDVETVEPYATSVNDMVAAVYKAITTPVVSPSTWYTIGGRAFDTQFGSVEYFSSDDGEYHGAMVPIVCMYRVSENNPFENRA